MQNHAAGRGRSLAALWVGLAVAGLGARALGQQEGAVWDYPSDGSWIAETVSLGAGGTQVFTEVGSYSNRRLLLSSHDQDPPSPVWADAQVDLNYVRRVASSRDGDTHAAMHQEHLPGQSWRHAILRKYSSSSPSPDWTYEFPVLISNHSYTQVQVSADGQILVGVVYDFSIGRTQVRRFAASSGVPTASYAVDTGGPFRGFALSEDGSTMVFETDSRFSIFATATGNTLFSRTYFPQMSRGAVGIDGTGSVAAIARDGTVTVYGRQANGSFEPTLVRALPEGAAAAALAVSRDGSSIGWGLNFPSHPSRARVQLLERTSGLIRTDHTFEGGGTLSNSVSAVELSDDGRRLVLGLWGDEQGLTPKVAVFTRGVNAPTFQFYFAGSAMSLDLSADGSRVAVAFKGTHATLWGGSGSISLLGVDRHDFELAGAPRAGSVVEFRQEVAPATPALVLASGALAAQPEDLGVFGTLHLSRHSMVSLPRGTVGQEDGIARTSYSIPGGSQHVGATVYFQGLDLAHRRLSSRYVPLTVLP